MQLQKDQENERENGRMDETELKSLLPAYIGKKLRDQEGGGEKEGRDFLLHLGMDGGNLRRILALEDPFTALSGQEYRWNDLYGKKVALDVGQYMRTEAAGIKEKLKKKSEEILNKFDRYFVPALAEKDDAAFAVRQLDRSNPDGLYSILSREQKQDYGYLMSINRQTYEEITQEEEEAKKERAGIFGRREEKIDDLFSSVDSFLQQRYEIYRYKAMESIYQEVLGRLEKYDVSFPMQDIPPAAEAFFDQMDIYGAFSSDFLKTFDKMHFAKLIPEEKWKVAAARIRADRRKIEEKTKKIQENPLKCDISIIIEAIQNNCLVMKKNKAILSEYGIIKSVDYNSLSLKEILELLLQLRQIEKKPVKTVSFETNGERDYDSLLKNEEFRRALSDSVRAVRTNKAAADRLRRLL